MVSRTARAALLGAVATTLAGGAGAWLLREAARGWPGRGSVHVHAGLDFLVLGAAGVLSAWLAVLLAMATLSLASTAAASAGGTARGSVGPPFGGRLTARVAAGLLIASGIGASPATAVGGPLPAVVATDPARAAVAPDTSALTTRGTSAPTTPQTTALTTSQATAVTTSGRSLVAEADGTRTGVGAGYDADDGSPARADDAPVPGWTPTVTRVEPARTATGDADLVTTRGSVVAGSEDEVVVHRGDTLWGIAARHLGAQATDQDVAEAWPKWYAANRQAIGDDPDLILPGQRLVPPASEDHR